MLFQQLNPRDTTTMRITLMNKKRIHLVISIPLRSNNIHQSHLRGNKSHNPDMLKGSLSRLIPWCNRTLTKNQKRDQILSNRIRKIRRRHSLHEVVGQQEVKRVRSNCQRASHKRKRANSQTWGSKPKQLLREPWPITLIHTNTMKIRVRGSTSNTIKTIS